MSLTPICRRSLSAPSAFCRNSRFLLIAAALIVLGPKGKAHTHEGTHYPDAVLELTPGYNPFAPVDSDSLHTFPLKSLRESPAGKMCGAGITMEIETLGQKLLFLNTAARGLLLKGRPEQANGMVHIPDWIRPGPGIQTVYLRHES
jgi:hypothetical protein